MLYRLRERRILRESIEYIVERTREYCFNLQYSVTRVSEVVHCADDRQSGTHVSLKTELHAASLCSLLQKPVTVVVTRGGNLVCCNDVDVMLKQRLV